MARCFYLESQQPFGHFARLVRQIESQVISGRPPYQAPERDWSALSSGPA